MTNVSRYLIALEMLKFPNGQASATDNKKSSTSTPNDQLMQENLDLLKKYVNKSYDDIINIIVDDLQVKYLLENIHDIVCDEDFPRLYIIHLEYVLLEIIKNTNFDSDTKEDLISTRHINLCIEALQNLCFYALRQQLHTCFYTGGVYAQKRKQRNNADDISYYTLLRISIEFYTKVLHVKQFHMANSMELVIRDYMAAIYTLYLANDDKEYILNDSDLKMLRFKLNDVWLNMTKFEYFRNIMLLRGIPQLPTPLQRQLQHELMQKLMSADGFTTLVAVLHTSQRSARNASYNEKHTFEVVANIVASRANSLRFQHNMIIQIMQFVEQCLLNEHMADCMGVGILALRRLYDLRDENKLQIHKFIDMRLKKLTQPDDLLSGLIVMEYNELLLLISLQYHLFCTSSVECLPSDMLIKCLPLFIQLYYNLPATSNSAAKHQCAALVLRCLNNRTNMELHQIIEKLYTLNYDADWEKLHERLIVVPNREELTECTVKVASAEYRAEFSISLALPELLMSEQHNTLTYKIFMILLRLLSQHLNQEDGDSEANKIDLLQTEDELVAWLNSKYPIRVEILLSLNTLISHQSLKSQMVENATEFLQLLRSIIEMRIKMTETSENSESSDQILHIMLTLTQEMLEQTQAPELYRDFMPQLQRLQQRTPNELVKQRITCLLTLLGGEFKANAEHNTTAFNTARNLIESHESHLQVYGIQMILDLLRRHDSSTLANVHIIIALALNRLHDKESYTFLNCVRLFVALVHVMESEVLDMLADEYLNEQTDMDYRLVVGEAMLKVSQELGPLCYKYKEVLLNCFMHGARSQLDEFRMSSFANLAQLCRILAYQVHKFFEELLHLINCELSTGKYLPAKRAAVMVLSELLEGMDNLIDFQDMLLPIYRLLKIIEAADESKIDEKTHLHAVNGLKVLNAKCHKLLFPEDAQQLQKEIKILNIKDNTSNRTGVGSGKLKRHILDLS